MSEPALVLDGAQRSALAVVRSLGRQGIQVYAGDTGTTCLASRSRYCAGHTELPAPPARPGDYASAVVSAARAIGAKLIVPVTDASMMLLLGNKPGTSGAPIPIAGPPLAAYERLSDKGALVDLATRLDIPVPRTIAAHSREELVAAMPEIGFPCVLKPARSKLRQGDRLLATSVSVVHDAAELENHHALDWLGVMPILVQEFIPGSGAGVFALYGRDGPVTWFAHRRLREKPPAGGLSVLCESVAVDPVMQGYAERLLSAVSWFGPAMVEFRVDPAGKPWLMEINGRFWGSLQLAVDCGVDFPWLLYQLCHGEDVRGPDHYDVGRRLRWLLGDVDHLLLQLRGKGTADSLGAKLASLGRFSNFCDSRARFEVLRRGDMGPFRHELRQWFRALR